MLAIYFVSFPLSFSWKAVVVLVRLKHVETESTLRDGKTTRYKEPRFLDDLVA